jgi:hypothetical protein
VTPTTRALAAPLLWRPTTAAASGARWASIARGLLIAAVLVNMLVSANLLLLCGIHYSEPGGNPFAKFHPGTYLALAALAVLLCERNEPLATLRECWHRDRAIMLYFVSLSGCVLFALIANGPSGTAVYIESFAPAGILALILGRAPPATLRRLGYAMVALFAVSALLALGETLLHERLIPVFSLDTGVEELKTDYRGTGLWDHPLTGAAMTMIGVVLLLATPMAPLWRGVLLCLSLAGLISFGGRTAFALTLLTLAGYGGAWLGRRLLLRQLQLRHVALAVIVLLVIPMFVWALASETSAGERLFGHLYWDDSAQSRAYQLRVLAAMTPPELLFGASFDRLQEIVFNIGLAVPFGNIENFWLMILAHVGIFGFLVFLAGFLPFVYHLWKVSTAPGRVILLLVLLVASTSNSIGRKSNLLTIGVAAILAANALRRSEPPPPAPAAAAAARRGDSAFVWRQ